MHSALDALGISPTQVRLLEAHGFLPDTFFALQHRLASGSLTAASNYIQAPISAPDPSDILPWPAEGSPQAAGFTTWGRNAIHAGQVAVCILNGGMATRFGGIVKGTVEVLPNQSFLALHFAAVARFRAPIPIFVMNSFATEAATLQHLQHHGYFGVSQDNVHLISQNMGMRLCPDGSLYRNAQGQPSFYAPGHGDVFEVLAKSVGFQQFVAQGGKMVMITNVDNIGAILLPKLVGLFFDTHKQIMVEVTKRAPTDMGGLPMRVGQRVEILESFRVPPQVHLAPVPVFNTNTLWASVNVIRPDVPLTWFRADKRVDGDNVVQFERLMGEITALVDSAYVEVPRQGPEGRFLPVKTPDDLQCVARIVREQGKRSHASIS